MGLLSELRGKSACTYVHLVSQEPTHDGPYRKSFEHHARTRQKRRGNKCCGISKLQGLVSREMRLLCIIQLYPERCTWECFDHHTFQLQHILLALFRRALHNDIRGTAEGNLRVKESLPTGERQCAGAARRPRAEPSVGRKHDAREQREEARQGEGHW